VNRHKSGKTAILDLLAVLLLLAITACRLGAQQISHEYASFDAFVETLESSAGSGKRRQANAFWKALVDGEQMPFVHGDQVAFLPKLKWVTVLSDAAAFPQGRLILAVAYILLSGYVIPTAGDYVNAPHLQRLERVPGVRRVIEANLGAASAT
jgi:hypothetical protein